MANGRQDTWTTRIGSKEKRLEKENKGSRSGRGRTLFGGEGFRAAWS